MLILAAAAPIDENAVPSKFGASDVQDLNWVQLLNAIHVQSAVVVLRLVLLILRVKIVPVKS
jgi:hypothetical protein